MEVIHDAYNKARMHVHEVGMMILMHDSYWGAFVHVVIHEHAYGMLVD